MLVYSWVQSHSSAHCQGFLGSYFYAGTFLSPIPLIRSSSMLSRFAFLCLYIRESNPTHPLIVKAFKVCISICTFVQNPVDIGWTKFFTLTGSFLQVFLFFYPYFNLWLLQCHDQVSHAPLSHSLSLPPPLSLSPQQKAKKLRIHRTVNNGRGGEGSSWNVSEAINDLYAERIGHGYNVLKVSQRAKALWDKTRSFWDIKNSLSHEWGSERSESASDRVSAARARAKRAVRSKRTSERCERTSERTS